MTFDTIISIALGIGLAASTGFRVFLPLFALSLSAYFGLWPLNESWQWLGSTNALIILGIAAIVESLGYLIPFIDNLLDTIAVPLAGLAGTAVMASTAADLSPAVTWALAIIAGGGAAAAIKGANATTRAASTATTGGLANPIFSVAETGTAVVMTALSLFVPILAVFAVVMVSFWLYRKYTRYRRSRVQV
ncbi:MULTISPECIES: DUF4126 domain-containing protein [unclassified Neisseria]|uniref:DUF4126 domain-containing protein n=1 Tax=unclassified Neisseria TaxID=2623750 RepID=UPI002665C449|nr:MULTISPECIES: DUF4126 domain-containing protein [unclassified Neisseria]MDO1510644.1 DUF4126 domain-containing protein [Neisseria sp. MVDL19-042950]MDO1516232.1 DUF4126 domain-containing protein [Neisseria sp. MVDL18-041461]MDO1564296.1 DUF4126 domain-containing protein [Neisseria sp. MVDL20-010259]